MKLILAGCIATLSAIQACWPQETAEENPRTFTIHPVGVVEKTDGKVAVVIESRYEDALLELDRYSHVWVIFWFDQNDTQQKRSILRVHPRGNRENPLAGVFACRAPFRPNLIGLSLCAIRSVTGNRIEIEDIDAFHGTPVIDLKPYIPGIDAATEVRAAQWRAKEEAPE